MSTKLDVTSVHTRLDIEGGVGLVEIRQPPNNFLDLDLLRQVSAAMLAFDADPRCRSILLCSRGKHFCAGRDFGVPRAEGDESAAVYEQAAALIELGTPWVAAVQGGAIGAGLGLAMAADFRVAGPKAYFAANFANLGLHHGFGLSLTLPRIIGVQQAARMLYTGQRIDAETADRCGLVDELAGSDDLLPVSLGLAGQLAMMPPNALASIRRTLRGDDFAERFRQATAHESREQARLRDGAEHDAAVQAAKARAAGRASAGSAPRDKGD